MSRVSIAGNAGNSGRLRDLLNSGVAWLRNIIAGRKGAKPAAGANVEEVVSLNLALRLDTQTAK